MNNELHSREHYAAQMAADNALLGDDGWRIAWPTGWGGTWKITGQAAW
jgi:hypothetical protein